MTSHQNIVDRIRNKVEVGELSIAEANVQMVRMERVRVVCGRMPKGVRSALNVAVKNGELGHMKKEGHKPEVYFHPTFDYMARAERNRIEAESIRAIASTGLTSREFR